MFESIDSGIDLRHKSGIRITNLGPRVHSQDPPRHNIDWETYISRNYPQPDKFVIQIVRPTFSPANLRIHFDGAIFLEGFSYHNHTMYDVVKFLVKFTNVYPLWVKSVCRQKLFDSCVDDVIQLITEYLPPFDPNGPFVLVTHSGRPYNMHQRLLDATHNTAYRNHSNIYCRYL